ncbi:hypothetical protein AMAG_20402 [Allomyces macrogynus ATCC 38327]|uniref:Uncharacterized protein n=1 Tax=Allomyces macrogynus (strain ATCC 38327) TaxID=578462 RepID=A0A0L0T8M1_ALLM3|nr:hypothetical protein AMAG_20402 [Allomyces macrogynus ATCC 38327]|eukprot:KNE71158.1 hypothetical protein AMAG_20402 [Allomyces macrogynus ATCC 38327]
MGPTPNAPRAHATSRRSRPRVAPVAHGQHSSSASTTVSTTWPPARPTTTATTMDNHEDDDNADAFPRAFDFFVARAAVVGRSFCSERGVRARVCCPPKPAPPISQIGQPAIMRAIFSRHDWLRPISPSSAMFDLPSPAQRRAGQPGRQLHRAQRFGTADRPTTPPRLMTRPTTYSAPAPVPRSPLARTPLVSQHEHRVAKGASLRAVRTAGPQLSRRLRRGPPGWAVCRVLRPGPAAIAAA